jgi:hypothetical protein
LNQRRLRVGGDLAGLLAILPPGVDPEDPPDPDEEAPEFAAGPIDETPPPANEPEDPLGGPSEAMGETEPTGEIVTDPDPDEAPLEDDADDIVGDASALLDPAFASP